MAKWRHLRRRILAAAKLFILGFCIWSVALAVTLLIAALVQFLLTIPVDLLSLVACTALVIATGCVSLAIFFGACMKAVAKVGIVACLVAFCVVVVALAFKFW